MAIFPYLDLETTVQVGDRTRLDASKTFFTPGLGDVASYEIDAGDGYIDVTTDKYLDYAFGSSGVKQIVCRVITASGVDVSGATGVGSASLTVVTAAQDNLYATDQDLKQHEPDILKWVEDGRNTFLNIHRRAKKVMLDWLTREGYRNWNLSSYNGTEFYNLEEVNQWATFTALRLIFEGMSNSTDDIFHQKSLRYSEMEMKWRSTLMLRIKFPNNDGTFPGTAIDTRTITLFRR